IGLLAAATSVRADELVLSNGDRLTGTVVSMSKGKLQFNTALAGTVTVSWKEAASLVSETTVKPERRDDSVAVRRLAPTDSGQVAVIDANGGVETVAMTDTHSIATPPKTWKGDLVGGMNIQRGNADRTAGSVDAHLVRRTEDDRLTLAASWGSSR